MWFWHILVHDLWVKCHISHMIILYERTHPHLRAHVFEFLRSAFLTKIIDFFIEKIKKNPQFWHIWIYNFNIVHQIRHMMVLYASRNPQLHAYVFRFSISWLKRKYGTFSAEKIRNPPDFVKFWFITSLPYIQSKWKCCIDVVHDAYNNCLHDSPVQNDWPVAILLLKD